MKQSPPLFILSGAPGSGKTSVARALAEHFKLSLHIPVDELREWVVVGRADPIPTRTAEADRQLALARQTSAHMADLYANAGFAVVVDDLLLPAEATQFFEAQLEPQRLFKVLLHPAWETVLDRNIQRGQGRFDAARWTTSIRALYEALEEQPFIEMGWTIVDSSLMTASETAQTILERWNG